MEYTALSSEIQFRAAPAYLSRNGTVVGVISNDEPDMHNTVLLPNGCDYSHYMRVGGAVTWEHGHDKFRGLIPVGKCEQINPTDKGLVGEVCFRSDSFSTGVYNCYKDGTIRGFSVDFIPVHSTPPTKQELRDNPSWHKVEEVYRSWILRGIAATATPSCPGALALQVRSALHALQAPSKPLTKAQERQVIDAIRAVTAPEHVEFMMNIARERRALKTQQAELDLRADCLRRGVSLDTLDAVLVRKAQQQQEIAAADSRWENRNRITGYY